MHYRIGTRGSKLALVQSEYVKRRMEEAYPEDTFELVIIKTTGDKVTDKPLAAIGTKGLFVKEIEEELLSGSIDTVSYTHLVYMIILGPTSENGLIGAYLNKYRCV